MNFVAAFQSDFLEDIIPLVESQYRVQADRDHRAIAGLSMGGGQSLSIGLGHPELFGWVGGFSAAVFNPETTLAKVLDDPKATNDRMHLLWIGCGKDDRLVENARQLSDMLKTKDIRHTLVVSEGAHSWPVWRIYLGQFLPLLFVDSK